MKKVILVFFAAGISLAIFAQKSVKLENLSIYQLNTYRAKAVELRNYGRTITISGLGIIAAGGCITALWLGSLPPDEENFGFPAIPMVIGLAVGIPFEIVGIPLWIIGGERKSRVDVVLKRYDNLPERSAPSGLGLGLTVRF